MQEHADGGLYCAVCGEHPDPVRQALKNYRAAVEVVRSAEYVKKQAAQALYEARSGRLRQVAAQSAESAAWPGVVVNREG